MKHIFLTCSILTISLILIPLAVMKNTQATPVSTMPAIQENDGYISVMKSENGKVETVSEREYIIGSLAAEMDFSYHDEALKAQAVACYTYAAYIKNKGVEEDLNGADISDDSGIHQGYINAEERAKKWGENFEKYEKKAGEIVNSIEGKMIVYDGKPILAVYHDLNNGKTLDAETVWKEKIPYLVGKESPGDKLSPDYSKEVEFTYDDFRSRLEKIDGVVLNEEKENWIGKSEKTESGYVKNVEICNEKISSEDFCTALELGSRCFTVTGDKNAVRVNVFGNGHMVGMSQYGADYMARQGADYVEILKYYYTNVEIQ